MTETDILIIGAGAAGLLAARNLAQTGKRVIVLEARDRIGGRIHTFSGQGFSGAVEAGAEFMHGEVPLTRQLMRAAGIRWRDTAGRAYEVERGRAREAGEFIDNMPLLLEKLQQLPHDLPLADFLHQYLPGDQHRRLRESATRFAEGYDAADAQRASTFALRDEWAGGGAEDSPRPVGGYGQLAEWLARAARHAGADIRLSSVAEEIRWQPGRVEVDCASGEQFAAAKCLITVPLGVWQASEDAPGFIRLRPDLPERRAAARQLGFGPVIKVLLEFDADFWTEPAPAPRHAMPEMGFIFSDAAFPTWWSQLPAAQPLLSGWLGGPAAARHRDTPDEQLLAEALDSLAYLLGTTPDTLRQHLRAHSVHNWGADPFARGAYAYTTVDSAAARQTLAEPVADTLFFAGEGLYSGPATGTVEAALANAGEVAGKLM